MSTNTSQTTDGGDEFNPSGYLASIVNCCCVLKKEKSGLVKLGWLFLGGVALVGMIISIARTASEESTTTTTTVSQEEYVKTPFPRISLCPSLPETPILGVAVSVYPSITDAQRRKNKINQTVPVDVETVRFQSGYMHDCYLFYPDKINSTFKDKLKAQLVIKITARLTDRFFAPSVGFSSTNDPVELADVQYAAPSAVNYMQFSLTTRYDTNYKATYFYSVITSPPAVSSDPGDAEYCILFIAPSTDKVIVETTRHKTKYETLSDFGGYTGVLDAILGFLAFFGFCFQACKKRTSNDQVHQQLHGFNNVFDYNKQDSKRPARLPSTASNGQYEEPPITQSPCAEAIEMSPSRNP